MIRFGLNTFLVSPGFTDADLSLISQFKRYGAEVIELAIVDPAAVSVPKLNQALEEAGLTRPIVCGAFGGGRDLRGTPSQVAETTAYIEELIDLAVRLGSNLVCGPMYSETGRAGAHSASERSAQLEQIGAALKPLCSKAEQAGVILAFEPLNRFETDCINTLAQAVDLIERVGSPALKIHMDTFHMHIEEDDSAAAIRAHGQHIAHVHASASHRGLLGQDQVNWEGVLSALSDIGYDGDIVIESFTMDNQIIAKAAAIWRPLYESSEQLSVEGLNFLRKQWKQLSPSKSHLVVS
jgi:D-psicose/D-tagatose/L-ribulose 3-epimerase